MASTEGCCASGDVGRTSLILGIGVGRKHGSHWPQLRIITMQRPMIEIIMQTSKLSIAQHNHKEAIHG